MTRDKLIKSAVEKLKRLPDNRLEEISGYMDFLLKKKEDKELTEGIQKLSADAKAFKFLEDEEDIYSVNDLKEVYK